MTAAVALDPVLIRDARPSDLAFVLNAWEQSYITRAKALIGKEIRRLVRTARCIVACDRADDDTLIGFAVVDPGLWHYVYVKDAFRGECISHKLIADAPADAYTFRTDVGESRLKPEARGLKYQPRIVL